MILNKNIFIKLILIFLIFISFFFGYFFNENSVGGGQEFFRLSWPIIQSLKSNFLFTINNYGTFGDGTIPFSHLLNAYINPFTDSIKEFQLSVTIISFLIFIVFAAVLKKTFLEINFVDIILTSSVLLILPFYRTSAFWGKNENYGWLFFILALYFFFKIRREGVSKTPNKNDILNIILFCFTSACSLYARQMLIFLPVSYLLYLLFNNANNKIFITSIISYAIFSIPGFILIWIWGDIYDTKNLPSNQVYGQWLHPKYIFSNIPILLSFFGFYLLPILVIDFFHSGFKKFFKEYYKSFFSIIVLFVILSQFHIFNYLGKYTLGGGAVLKINLLIDKNNFFLLLFFSAIGFSIIFRFFKEDIKNNSIILLPLFIPYLLPNLLYQEYVEPLILVIFFLALKTELHKVYFKNISFSNFVFIFYFMIYLVGSIYFKHFAFDSFEKWKLFLN